MIHTAQLDLENFGSDDDTDKPVWFDVWNYWNAHGYPIESIKEAHSVVHEKPNGENTAHVVVKVETLNKPLNRADVAVDTIDLWACDCGRFQFHESVDLEDYKLPEWGNCHHIEACEKSVRAANDEQQETL